MFYEISRKQWVGFGIPELEVEHYAFIETTLTLENMKILFPEFEIQEIQVQSIGQILTQLEIEELRNGTIKGF